MRQCVKDREIIADRLSKAGWSWGCVSAIDSNGRTICIADARRDDGKRFVARAEEKLTAFLELESAIRGCRIGLTSRRRFFKTACCPKNATDTIRYANCARNEVNPDDDRKNRRKMRGCRQLSLPDTYGSS